MSYRRYPPKMNNTGCALAILWCLVFWLLLLYLVLRLT